MKNGEILANYSGYGVFMCFFGALIGAIVSPLIVPNMIFETYDVIFNLPQDEVKMIFPFGLAATIILFAMIIGYFSSFFVCLNLVFKTPKDCMSGNKKIKLKSRKKMKNRFGMFGSALKNMKINKTRSIMSVAGIAGCSLLNVIGFGLTLGKNFVKTSNFLSFETFLKVFQSFSLVILCLTLFILAVQIFKERAKEMAMLRINGTSYLNIWLIHILEMLVVGAIGFLIAGLLSYPVLILMLRMFGVNGGIFINLWGFIKTFLLVFGFIACIGVYVMIKIRKLNLADAIKLSE